MGLTARFLLPMSYPNGEVLYMNDLLPCPFCGGKSEIYDVQSEYDDDFSGYAVMCKACGDSTTVFITQSKAIAAWNKRAPSERGNELEKILAALVNAYYDHLAADGMIVRSIHQAQDFLKLNAD